jgi:putative oxidoreductase
MANMNSFPSEWRPRVLSVLRIIVGFLLIAHGTQKIFGFPTAPPPPTPPAAQQQQAEPPKPPPPQIFMILVKVSGWLEFLGGLLIMLGLFTRPTAFILSGMMAVAYFIAHAPQGFWPILNKGELAVLYCFVFLYLVVAGGGPWSLDNLLRRGETSRI